MTNTLTIPLALAERLDSPHSSVRNAALESLRRILAAPVVERQAVAWRHTMHYEHGHRFELTDSPENPFGKPDIDYDKSFRVTCEPLYAEPHAPVAVVLDEPIYQVEYRGDGGGGWVDVDKESYDMKLPHPKHWRTRIVYACLDKVKELNK